MSHAIEQGDIDALGQILEMEKVQHTRMRAIGLGLFVVFALFTLLALVMMAARLAQAAFADVGGDFGEQLWQMQLLAPLFAAVLGSLGYWWSVQSCVNSIDRALYAARCGRQALFTQFLGQISCAGDKKKKLWAEVLKSVVM